MKKKTKKTPICWTTDLNGETCLGFAGGKFLPNFLGKSNYPKYFDKNGKPILDMLPMENEKDSE